jgi:hypothetical protein
MGVLEDILKALDRVEIWKEVQNTPQRVKKNRGTGREARRQMASGRLSLLWGAWRSPQPRDSASQHQGFMIEDWKCEKCGKTDVRAHKPSTR